MDRFEELMRQYGFNKTRAEFGLVRFEKEGLVVESWDSAESFVVRTASNIHTCAGFENLAEYLRTLL
jgi:hypothetical protein